MPACRATVVILPMKLLGKPPLANKMQKFTRKHVFKPADAGSLSMF